MTRRLVSLTASVGCWILIGCNSAPPSSRPVVKAKAAPTEELADVVQESLQRSNDLAACRHLTEQLNVALARGDARLKSETLTSEQQSLYSKEAGLAPNELAEIGRGEFTPLDAAAMEEAFLFRDAAKSLDVAGLPPAKRAQAALEWVVRNVRAVPASGLAAPPVSVVLRGAGSGLERTYVLLALLRQLDFDAALLGDASGEPDKVWGVAVRTDDGVYVLDARLGLPLPAAGTPTATLAQVRKDDGVSAALNIDAKTPYDVTPDRARSSIVHVAVPLSSLAPRMKLVQSLLPQGSAHVFTDIVALRDRFRQSLQGPGYDGCEVRLWASPSPDAWPRVLMAFLPVGDGGSDRAEPGRQRRDLFQRDLVPWTIIPPFLLQLPGEPGARTQRSFASRILTLRQPGQARDLILRGDLQDATEKLVTLQEELDRPTLPVRELAEDSRGWADAARGVYADLLRAERTARTDPAAAASIPEIREKIDNLWKKSMGPKMFLDLLAAPVMNEEATFLLALTKHEQAVRATYVAGGKSDPAIWESARKWWLQYINTYAASPASTAARRNLAMVLAGEGNRPAAVKELQSLADSPHISPLDRIACLVFANQLK